MAKKPSLHECVQKNLSEAIQYACKIGDELTASKAAWERDPQKIRIEAEFDQINALNRDAMKAIKSASRALFQMPEEERTQVVNQMPPEVRVMLQAMADELGDQRLSALLSGDASNG